MTCPELVHACLTCIDHRIKHYYRQKWFSGFIWTPKKHFSRGAFLTILIKLIWLSFPGWHQVINRSKCLMYGFRWELELVVGLWWLAHLRKIPCSQSSSQWTLSGAWGHCCLDSPNAFYWWTCELSTEFAPDVIQESWLSLSEPSPEIDPMMIHYRIMY